jgi:hypothetical protein
VLVANGRSIITPRLWLYPGIRPDDGWLDVLAFTLHGPVQVASTLGRLAVHGLAGSRYVTRVRGGSSSPLIRRYRWNWMATW